MVLFVGYHATSPGNRPSILRSGLIAQRPHHMQQLGVYVFSPGLCNDHNPRAFVEWGPYRDGDLWRVAYCGPMKPDQFCRNAAVLPSVTDVTLVTGNE